MNSEKIVFLKEKKKGKEEKDNLELEVRGVPSIWSRVYVSL